jgi:DNA modification methylase
MPRNRVVPPRAASRNWLGGVENVTSWPADRVERRPIEGLILYARNARTHSDAQVAQIAASMREWGWTNPILVAEDGTIIAGHGRLLAAQRLGWAEAPVMVAAGWTEAQRRAYALADNKLALNAGWDEEMLSLELSELQDANFDIGLIGFSEEELAAVMSQRTTGRTDPDDIPSLPLIAATEPGDIWLLGKHRLMCGDSTDPEQIARLMKGERAICSITDPPYSVNYEESHKHRGGNKDVHASYHEADINPTELLEFLGCLPTDLIIFSYSVNRHLYVLADSLRKHRWDVRKELVWVKDQFSFWKGAAYQQKHEPFWICTRNNAGFRGNVDAKQSTVIEYPKPKAHDLHPTAKPVEMWVQFVKNHSNAGELIVEPFSGSGTSIIAAQQTDRRCYAMELAPQYVDVAVKRWQEFTGLQATLDADGATFADISSRRGTDARSQAHSDPLEVDCRQPRAPAAAQG